MIYQNKAWKKETGFKLSPTGEPLEPTYQEKAEEIMEAIREGKEFFIETYLGRLKINGISPEGDWAYTGACNIGRSWAICSREIDEWHGQLEGREK